MAGRVRELRENAMRQRSFRRRAAVEEVSPDDPSRKSRDSDSRPAASSVYKLLTSWADLLRKDEVMDGGREQTGPSLSSLAVPRLRLQLAPVEPTSSRLASNHRLPLASPDLAGLSGSISLSRSDGRLGRTLPDPLPPAQELARQPPAQALHKPRRRAEGKRTSSRTIAGASRELTFALATLCSPVLVLRGRSRSPSMSGRKMDAKPTSAGRA